MKRGCSRGAGREELHFPNFLLRDDLFSFIIYKDTVFRIES